MRGEIPGKRPALGVTAAALAAMVVGLAGCGGHSSSAASASSSAAASSLASSPVQSSPVQSAPAQSSPSASTGQASSQGSPGTTPKGPLTHSKLKVLTELTSTQLCSVLSKSEANKVLGATTAAPLYANRPGLGNTCEWAKKGTSQISLHELYVGISSVVDWSQAQAVDRLLRTTPVTIDGHPALAASQQGQITWAQVDVALGGDGDPVVEYRAPTMAIALTLARDVTPLIGAFG